jgi:hypothetical protein
MWHRQTHITRIWTAETVYLASLGGSLGFAAPPSDWLRTGFTPSQQPYTQPSITMLKAKNPADYSLKSVLSLR